MKNTIIFADLSHTAQGVSAATFPLGVSFVVSHARQHFGDTFTFRLFKFPADLERALLADAPCMLCMSNYSWNCELACRIAELAKSRDPGLVVVLGGPNFPIVAEEKAAFLARRPAVDFYIELEGELGFVDLVTRLMDVGFDVARLKREGIAPLNTTYLVEDRVVTGPMQRIADVNALPSPYLTGVLDPFFELPLVPMIETTRGCPFSCTFCADGIAIKNRVTRFAPERTRDELNYIARRIKNIDELIVTDLNFAMYAEDLETAKVIADIQRTHHWPRIISASAGKNKPKRTIEVASVLGGTWMVGASIQSTNPDVLKAIKRSNISSAAYRELISYGNSLENSKTHSEIILGLPGDTKERHFESLRFGIENNVNSIRMFQAMLLVGTDMAEPATRREYGLLTRFRTIPGCVGIYDLFGGRHAIAEIEEIIVGSNSLPFEDYLECRVMNLIIETFHNNALFEEVFGVVHAVGGSAFDVFLRMKEQAGLYSPAIAEIIGEFKKQTMVNLFESYDQAKAFVLTPEVVEKYVGGELGINELLVHRALLYCAFGDICHMLFEAARMTLRQGGLLTAKVSRYLDELQEFIILRKKDIFVDTRSVRTGAFHYDFEAVRSAGYRVDPNQLPEYDMPRQLFFYHDSEQRRHIANQVRVYARSTIGLGRLIQRSNLKLMYRSFSAERPEQAQLACDAVPDFTLERGRITLKT